MSPHNRGPIATRSSPRKAAWPARKGPMPADHDPIHRTSPPHHDPSPREHPGARVRSPFPQPRHDPPGTTSRRGTSEEYPCLVPSFLDLAAYPTLTSSGEGCDATALLGASSWTVMGTVGSRRGPSPGPTRVDLLGTFGSGVYRAGRWGWGMAASISGRNLGKAVVMSVSSFLRIPDPIPVVLLRLFLPRVGVGTPSRCGYDRRI